MANYIGLQIENSREHGRALLAGLADFALSRPEWRFDLIDATAKLDAATAAKYDGLVVRVMDARTERALRNSGRPVIDTYGRRPDAAPFDTIRLNDAGIAEIAAKFFAEHRFSECAFCGFAGLRFSSARGEAFAAAARKAGARCSVYRGGDASAISDAFFKNERAGDIPDAAPLADWVSSLPKPCAVLCCNDLRAFQLLRVCETRGVDVPGELAVLGVDDDPLLCTFTHPQLSSIDTGPRELGRRAGEMLAERLENPALPIRTELHTPKKIVERQSTQSYPFKTPWLSDAMVFIRRNLRRGISAGDVVAHLGYSHTFVNAAFKRELGASVHRAILDERLAVAKKLLRETDAPAARIASEAGFPDAQSFSRFFSAEEGVPPGVWRRGGQGAGGYFRNRGRADMVE